MSEEEKFDLCYTYAKLIRDCMAIGSFGFYGIDEMRIKLHQEIAETFKIDHFATKEITDHMPITENTDDVELSKIVKKLVKDLTRLAEETTDVQEPPIPPEWIREQIREYPGMHASSWSRLLRMWEEENA